MFDVFYSGDKPNIFPHEQQAQDIEHAQTLSRTRFFWWINSKSDYSKFDFMWEPTPWESHQRHAWASQWQKDNGTYLIPRLGYSDTNYHTEIIPRNKQEPYWVIPSNIDTTTFDWTWHHDVNDPLYLYQFETQHQRTGGPKYILPNATEVKYVDQVRVKSTYVAPIYEIDHLDGNTGNIKNVTKVVRYFDNYFDTLKRIANNSQDEFIWICSSVCDYSNFDFTWYPEQWQSTMLHVFPSNGEKFGDTFYMHVPTFRERANMFDLLEWYDLNFTGIDVPRRPLPEVKHTYDSQADAIKAESWNGPLAVFVADGSCYDLTTVPTVPTVPLWREKTKTIVPCSPGAGVTIVPKSSVSYIKKQAYDYPHILKTQRHMYDDQPLDIVFISNGEINADYNYEKLKFYAGDRNRIKRVDRVNGRVAAYHTAANASSTPWFFAVFAKLEVSADFDWSWQPDRLQQPKHYIFHARNPVNGLEYGHQAMIAYNKKLTLANTGQGLDFTLDSEHEVVPILSGTAHYHNDPWMCWRTAFREALKLRTAIDVESSYRLSQWLTENNSDDYVKWSHIGAQDAIEYYDSVNGDFEELKKSYDWAWLASYALIKRNLVAN